MDDSCRAIIILGQQNSAKIIRNIVTVRTIGTHIGNLTGNLLSFQNMFPILIYPSMDSYNFQNLNLKLFAKIAKVAQATLQLLSNFYSLHLLVKWFHLGLFDDPS